MTLEVLQRIVDELRRRGIEATLEYPGYISAMSDADDPSPINWGDANDTFAGDVMASDGLTVIETIETNISSDSAGVQGIANLITYYSQKGTK